MSRYARTAAHRRVILADDFSNLAVTKSKWNFYDSGTGQTVSGGRLRVNSTNDYLHGAETPTRDFRDAKVSVEIVTAPNVVGYEDIYMCFDAPRLNNLRRCVTFDVEEGGLGAYICEDDVWSTPLWWQSFSASIHWVRLRTVGPTVFWDTSADGVTWTNRVSRTPTWPIGSGFITLGAGGATLTAEFDNFVWER
jgi:hypothetical protein